MKKKESKKEQKVVAVAKDTFGYGKKIYAAGNEYVFSKKDLLNIGHHVKVKKNG